VTPTANPPSPPGPLITGTANGSNHATKVDLQALYQAVVSGLLAFYAPTDTFLMKSGTFTRDELVSQIQSFVAAIEKTKSSNQQWRQDVQAERALELVVQPLRVGVRAIVQTRFGKDGVQLLQFGFQPAKVVQRSAESLVLSQAKAKATRALRGTASKKAKAGLKGTVTTVTVGTPAPQEGAPAPATPAATPAPAAPAAVEAPAPAAPAAAPAAPATATPQH
jgi:hypothetical protein